MLIKLLLLCCRLILRMSGNPQLFKEQKGEHFFFFFHFEITTAWPLYEYELQKRKKVTLIQCFLFAKTDNNILSMLMQKQ